MRVCVECGTPFERSPKAYTKIYCCRSCKDAAWRLSNPDKRRAKDNIWWSRHKGRINAARREKSAQERAAIAAKREARRQSLAKLFGGSSHAGV